MGVELTDKNIIVTALGGDKLSKLSAAPSLRKFIQKRQTMSVYRKLGRACYAPINDTKKLNTDMLYYVRSEFEANKHIEDQRQISYLIEHANKQIMYIENMVGQSK